MPTPPKTEQELIERTQLLTGKTLGQIFQDLNLPPHKGMIGQGFEKILGSDAKNAAEPDFKDLSIELKTLPIGMNGQPKESTFITALSLKSLPKETWQTSRVYHKIKRILWVPIESIPQIPLAQRRIGEAFLWSPDENQVKILQADWEYLTQQIILGQLESISAHMGTYLQLRPKAANGKVLTKKMNNEGEMSQTLPRGFYLRTSFTKQLWKK